MTKNENPTQAQRVLEYMEKHGGITQFSAMQDLAVMRLASRISELKLQGYAITSEIVPVKNRFEETCYVKRYRLQGSETE